MRLLLQTTWPGTSWLWLLEDIKFLLFKTPFELVVGDIWERWTPSCGWSHTCGSSITGSKSVWPVGTAEPSWIHRFLESPGIWHPPLSMYPPLSRTPRYLESPPRIPTIVNLPDVPNISIPPLSQTQTPSPWLMLFTRLLLAISNKVWFPCVFYIECSEAKDFKPAVVFIHLKLREVVFSPRPSDENQQV